MSIKSENQKLKKIIRPYSDWFVTIEDVEKNKEAKEALKELYNKLKKVKPDTKYDGGDDRGHLGYIPLLLTVREALNDKLYARACNEVLSLIHYYPYRQQRVLKPLCQLLSEIFREEEKGDI